MSNPTSREESPGDGLREAVQGIVREMETFSQRVISGGASDENIGGMAPVIIGAWHDRLEAALSQGSGDSLAQPATDTPQDYFLHILKHWSPEDIGFLYALLQGRPETTGRSGEAAPQGEAGGLDLLALDDILSNLLAYGKIHTVEGVSSPSGTHKEYIERGDRFLVRLRASLQRNGGGK